MKLARDRDLHQTSNIEKLRREVVPTSEISGKSEMSDIVQLAIYNLPPMATPIFTAPYHVFVLALSDLPSLALCTDSSSFYAHPVKTGDWIFIPNNQILGSRWQDNSQCMHVYLNPIFVNNLLSANFLEDKVEFTALIGCQDAVIEHFLELFRKEFESNRLTDILYAEALAKALSLHLIRCCSNQSRLQENSSVYSQRSELQEIIDYIETNLGRELTIQSLAQQAQISISVFAHSFRKAIGISPYQFILQKRLEKSKQLLLEENCTLSIAAIAKKCGFSNASAFTNRFRQKEGVSPSQYRSDRSL